MPEGLGGSEGEEEEENEETSDSLVEKLWRGASNMLKRGRNDSRWGQWILVFEEEEEKEGGKAKKIIIIIIVILTEG